ncbi:hypothetical protein N8T08_004374 [Aspergillus melleus]|uniref:Uncharacterized protein n=1 Tax=Aspergillus melleus TaxID=138277 RepID=A0ACC3B4U0_9EURO|nr:hypothetical protein N8T08_004374 [Aspergillus melleus]
MPEHLPTEPPKPDGGWTFTRSDETSLRNISSWRVAEGAAGDSHLIQVSWPLDWPTDPCTRANVLYVVDGNAMFLTATEVVRQRQALQPQRPGTIVVGIGYPLADTASLWDARRGYDLTPPCEKFTPPNGPDGQPQPHDFGGADKFLHFITTVVQPFLLGSEFPRVELVRTALFGHSYGGLFVLHSLFTRPASFDTYLAASPSIWWNDRFVLAQESRFLLDPGLGSRPALRLCYGSREQFPVRNKAESDESFERQVQGKMERRMNDNCKELYDRLVRDGRLRSVEIREYPDEDHGSVIATALSGSILYFLDLED